MKKKPKDEWEHQELLDRHKLYLPDSKLERIPGTNKILIEGPEGTIIVIEASKMAEKEAQY